MSQSKTQQVDPDVAARKALIRRLNRIDALLDADIPSREKPIAQPTHARLRRRLTDGMLTRDEYDQAITQDPSIIELYPRSRAEWSEFITAHLAHLAHGDQIAPPAGHSRSTDEDTITGFVDALRSEHRLFPESWAWILVDALKAKRPVITTCKCRQADMKITYPGLPTRSLVGTPADHEHGNQVVSVPATARRYILTTLASGFDTLAPDAVTLYLTPEQASLLRQSIDAPNTRLITPIV